MATNVMAIVIAAVLLWKLRKPNASQATSRFISVTNPSSLDDINPQHYMELQLRKTSRRSDSKQTNQVVTGNATANPQQYETLQRVNQQNVTKPISQDYMELSSCLSKTYASLNPIPSGLFEGVAAYNSKTINDNEMKPGGVVKDH